MGMFQTTGSNERLAVLEGTRQRTIAAAGSAQADAALIGANITVVTAASGTNGVVLRKAKSGNPYTGMVYSSAATNALLVYPPVGGTINNGTANAALSVAARKPIFFVAVSAVDFIVNVGA